MSEDNIIKRIKTLYANNYTYEEIAERLNVSVNFVSKTLKPLREKKYIIENGEIKECI